jgi:hypothetical protein
VWIFRPQYVPYIQPHPFIPLAPPSAATGSGAISLGSLVVNAGRLAPAWLYRRPISDSTGGSLANVVCQVALTSANFDFSLAKSDGSDLRVFDETAVAVLPCWLLDYDSVAQTATVCYKATLTSHAHSLYYGNPAATAVSNFSAVFTHGTGFDADWGDLTTNTSGSTAAATRYPGPTSTSDSRNYIFWRLAETPTLSLSDLTAAGITAGNYTGVREGNLIRDTSNRVLNDGGSYYITFSRRPNNSTDTIDAWIAHSTSKSGPWTGFVQMWTPGAVHLDYPSSVLKVGSTYYCFTTYGWTVGGGTSPGLVVKLRTSTDLVTWTDQGTVLSPGVFNDITSGACTDIGNPWVLPLADGTYMMVVEGYNGANAVWSCYGATSSGPPFTTWTPLNSGNALVSKGAGGTWDFNGAANPKCFQRPDNSIVIEYNGSDDATNLDWQIGFASAATPAGPYTKNAANPIAGHTTATYGCETSHFSWDENGTDYFHFCQRFDTTSNTGHIFQLYQEKYQGGLIFIRATDGTDAAIAGRVLDAGNFTAETRSTFLAHRTLTPSTFLIAIQDSATVPTPTTGAGWAAGRRLEITRSGHDAATPGDLQLVYWDTSLVRHFWTGSAWSTSTTFIAADHAREIIASIADDGTNFILSGRYADDGTSLATASIAKASVKAFSSGRALYMGDPFTNTGSSAATYARYIMVRPYVATEPVLSLGVASSASPAFFTAPSSGAITLSPLSAAGVAGGGLFATGAITLGSLTTTGSAAFTSPGSGAISLAPLSSSGAGRFTASALGSVALAGLVSSGAGQEAVTASGSIVLAGLVVASVADGGGAPIDLAVYPDPFGSTVAVATDPFGGTGTMTTDPFASTARLKGS